MHFLSFIFGPMASFNRLAVGPLFFFIIYIIVVDKKINIVQNNECKEQEVPKELKMMKHEFEALAGYEVSTEDYDNIIEPMYSATNVSKAEFVKMINRKRFEVKKEEKKSVKVLNITDRSGHLDTPNGCFRHLVDVEVVDVSIKTGKIVVKVIPDTYRLGYSADFTVYDNRIEVQGA